MDQEKSDSTPVEDTNNSPKASVTDANNRKTTEPHYSHNSSPSRPHSDRSQHSHNIEQAPLAAALHRSLSARILNSDFAHNAAKIGGERFSRLLRGKTIFSSDTPVESNSSEDNSPIQSQPPSSLSSAESSPRLDAYLYLPRSLRATTLDIPGLTSSKVSPDGRISSRDVGAKLVIVMVGLPARGKSYIVEKLARYYMWQGHRCKVFNVGTRRRQKAVGEFQDASYFDPNNDNAKLQRDKVALETLEDLLDWLLKDNGSVAVYDATNTTLSRRRLILDRINHEPRLKALFIESICTDQSLLEVNMRLKLRGPDYKNRDSEAALRDFQERVHNYEKIYETIGTEEEDLGVQYCKLINVNKKIICHNIQGFLASQAVYFLLNFNLEARMIWIARHGESVDNIYGRIGGNAPLTNFGRRYAAALSHFIDEKRREFRNDELEQITRKWSIIPVPGEKAPTPGMAVRGDNIPEERSFSVWTSLLTRSIETAGYFDEDVFDVKGMRMLDEIRAGKIEGLTFAEFKTQFPEEYEARIRDQLHFRYPGLGGESYLDVIHRLNPVIVEIERMNHHVLVIGHRVTTRILLAYYLGLDQNTICNIDIPMHSVYCIRPLPYGNECRGYCWDPDQDSFVEQSIPFLKSHQHRRRSTDQTYKGIPDHNPSNADADVNSNANVDSNANVNATLNSEHNVQI